MPKIGDRIGRYEILALLGKGGMGEVYRGRDVTLGREVAIKVLPEELATDPRRLQRLRREARLLASLSHPNLATVFGLEEWDELPVLVLELVQGATLAERLAKGPLPLRRALEVAREIALGLEAAHRHGIVHRDLKPSNIMLLDNAQVKLLDFGLARAISGPIDQPETETAPWGLETSEGRIVGTLSYLSPEQARALPVDQRCDVWAFGCVYYEMLTGKRAFSGPTASDVLVSILQREPEWSRLAGYPEQVSRLIRRCLRKDREHRLHAIADARIEIEEALAQRDPMVSPSARAESWRASGRLALIGGLGALTIAAALLVPNSWRSSDPGEPLRRFSIDLGEDSALAISGDYPAAVAISPAGDAVAYVARVDSEHRIYLRRLDRFEARLIGGTEGAQQPFFSPDGQWLGFFADGSLKKVSLRGGAPIDLAEASSGMGGAWSPEGWIVFAPAHHRGLQRVDADGGQSEAFTEVRIEDGEQGHWRPALLPDGRSVLFTVWSGALAADSRLALAAERKPHRILLEGGSHPRFLAPGHLVYARGSTLLAIPFDSRRAAPAGTPFEVLSGIKTTTGTMDPIYDLSPDGTLVYAATAASTSGSRLVWANRSGDIMEEIESSDNEHWVPRLSPDRSRVVFHLASPDFDLWVRDLQRGTRLRLTDSQGWDGLAVWEPDSSRIAFSSARDGSKTLFVADAVGGGHPERLLDPGNPRWPTSWSPDGRWLAYYEESPRTGLDVWLLELETGQPVPFARSRFQEALARFSPDGQWLLYQSDESGRPEVYLAAFPDVGLRTQVSAGGGSWGIWSTEREVLFRKGTQMFAVDITMGERPQIGEARLLFDQPGLYVYDVHPDGSLLAVSSASEAVEELMLVLGWSRELAYTESQRP